MPIPRVFVIACLLSLVLVDSALAGMPSRSSFAFDEPLPNFFSSTQAE